MDQEYSLEIMELVKSFLEEESWKYRFDEKEGIFIFGVDLSAPMRKIKYLAYIGKKNYTVYAISPISADHKNPEQIQKIGEFICRANYGLRDGNFELDMNDGELRFKCYVNCNHHIPSNEVIQRSFYCPISMIKRYGKGIPAILFKGMSPEDAVDLCEGRMEERGQEEEKGEEENLSSYLLDMLHQLQDGLEENEDSQVVDEIDEDDIETYNEDEDEDDTETDIEDEDEDDTEDEDEDDTEIDTEDEDEDDTETDNEDEDEDDTETDNEDEDET